MSDARSLILEALRRIAAGGEVTFDELFAIPDPASLDKIEIEAWRRLNQWVDDGDIRARDPDYREMQEKQVSDALADLEALEAGYSPSEIGWGEHRAPRVRASSCLLVIGGVALAIYLFTVLF